ncbi:MAG TPA: phosphatase PAP2 family protein, partial [Candidatus Limnocylindrales bacterium]
AAAPDRSSGMDGISIAWLVLAVFGLVAFAAITVEMLNHVAWPFDQSILATVRPWVGDGTIWRVLSESANIPLIIIGVGMVIVLFLTHRRREAVLVALILIAVTAGSEGIKQLVARPRPEGTDPNIPGVVYSYPSGHVLEALVIFGVIAIHVLRSHLSRVVAAIAAVAVIADAFLVGLSRLILNAHWPSDAMASLIAGAGVLGIYGLLTHGDAWATKRSDRHDDPEPAAEDKRASESAG